MLVREQLAKEKLAAPTIGNRDVIEENLKLKKENEQLRYRCAVLVKSLEAEEKKNGV